MRTRVKICGITRPEDAQAAVAAGTDALGLVFYPPSPRAVTPIQAQAIISRLPPFVTIVGLFVNAPREDIEATLAAVSIDLLQFHGDESPADCMGYGRPWIKAIPMRKDVDLIASRNRYQTASALLLDTYSHNIPGGTGREFDWTRIPKELSGEIILAGGLTADTVAQAVRQVRPYAVDVSGGVESSKGIKDAAKIMAFIRGVQSANQYGPA